MSGWLAQQAAGLAGIAEGYPALWETTALTRYLVLAAMLFSIGAIGFFWRRNLLVMFMCVELMLNAANLTFVAFGRAWAAKGGMETPVFVFIIMCVAAAEAAVGLGILVAAFRHRERIRADELNWLRR